jgi:nucleotide-binding universal stress UspA family protein
MNDIVVPIAVDRSALLAAEHAVAQYRREPALVHLVNVQRPLPHHVAQFLPREDLDAHYRDAGMQLLAPAMAALDAAGVPHTDHVLVGKPAQAIVQFAADHQSDRVLLDGEQPVSPLAALGLGSLASQVRHLMAANVQFKTLV